MPAEGIKESDVEGVAKDKAVGGDVQANGSNGEYRAPAAPVDDDPVETREWLDALDSRPPDARRGPDALPADAAQEQGQRRRRPHPLHRQHALHQHHPRRRPAALPRQPRHRTPPQKPRPLERHGHGRPGQQERRHHRRPHRHLRLVGHALRSRLQPLLPRARTIPTAPTRSTSRATPRPASTPAPSSKAGSAKSKLHHFRQELAEPAAACRRTRTRG